MTKQRAKSYFPVSHQDSNASFWCGFTIKQKLFLAIVAAIRVREAETEEIATM